MTAIEVREKIEKAINKELYGVCELDEYCAYLYEAYNGTDNHFSFYVSQWVYAGIYDEISDCIENWDCGCYMTTYEALEYIENYLESELQTTILYAAKSYIDSDEN